MKTILLLEDGNTQAKLMSQDPAHTKAFVRETKAVADCNCDRWGHPCAGCTEDKQGQRATVQDFTNKEQR